MRRYARPAAVAIVLCTLALGIAYPLAVTGIARVAFPGRAGGSIVTRDGRDVGSALIAQPFTRPVLDASGQAATDDDGNPVTEPDPRWFQPRPSVTGHDPSATFFSNRGPNSAVAAYAYRDAVQAVLDLEGRYVPGLRAARIPVDAVTTSASGVDPHISPAYARLQAPRIAAQRSLGVAEVRRLIDDHTDGRALGVLGVPGVNVLQLNLALDEKAPIR